MNGELASKVAQFSRANDKKSTMGSERPMKTRLLSASMRDTDLALERELHRCTTAPPTPVTVLDKRLLRK